MGWIKRNLFFAIGGVVALALLGAAGFYFYASWQRNNQAFDKLNEIYNDLKAATSQKPQPGKDGQNIQLARSQTEQLRRWIRQAQGYFQPIAPIPDPASGPLTSESFAPALHRTIADLQREAGDANVNLPPGYNFSFQAQSVEMKFAPDSLEKLARQLGEVKAISEILFATRVNGLEGIQRVRVSDEDTAGPQSDYIDESSVAGDLAVMTPYQLTFDSFTPEIAQVLTAFASSPHGFLIRTINVQPASAASTGPGNEPPPAPQLAPALAPGRGGLQTVLNEQLLRVTMEIEIVKLTPRY